MKPQPRSRTRLLARLRACAHLGLALALGLLLPGCTPEPAAPTGTEAPALDRGADTQAWWSKLPRPGWSGFERVPQSQPWFEVYRVRPGVLAIHEPGQFEEVISWLVVGDELALLWDTGLGVGDIGVLVAELTDRPVAVVNSHSHYDHTGGNRAFPDAIAARVTDQTRRSMAGRPNAQIGRFFQGDWVWKPLPEGVDPATFAHAPWRVGHVLQDGERLDLGGRVLEVLYTPGHASDSICLLDREGRLLLTGDTLYPAPLYTHLDGSDFDAYAASAERLAGLAPAVDVLLPSHNEPTMPARALVALRDAFRAIRAGDAAWRPAEGVRHYDFAGFSILVNEPPPWETEAAQ